MAIICVPVEKKSGVRGLDETVAALQEENRVYHLAALWELEAEIRWCTNDQLAIREVTSEECPFCGQKTRVRPLKDVLVDLAAARGARIDFVLGEDDNTDTLRHEFGSIAGLTRFQSSKSALQLVSFTFSLAAGGIHSLLEFVNGGV